ncbi:AraC family transcriptional regulator [Litoribacillus peritrichatus]|uniref:AraC family transcriptional regulator n=2 Tax=Litoribacillus peritrichatus TaxID=718191 RepID=A0ABP7MD62_9GAMM
MGIDIDLALSNSSFPSKLLKDDTARAQGSDFQALLSELIKLSNNPLFGLHSAQYVQPGSYVVLGYITMNSRTVKEAIDKAMPFEKLVGDMGSTELTQTDNGLLMTWHCNYTNPEVIPHMVDNVLASWVTYSRWLADRPEQAPIEVWLTKDKPNEEILAEYQEVFRCPIKFNQSTNTLVLSNAQLEFPLRRPDPMLLKTLEQHAQTQLSELTSDNDIIFEVTRAIRDIMRTEPPRKERLAEVLGVSARTLQRKLQTANSSYQELLDNVRQESAEYYLAYSQLPMSEIASHLGFSDTRSFHRSFKLWTDTTPGDYRIQKQTQ